MWVEQEESDGFVGSEGEQVENSEHGFAAVKTRKPKGKGKAAAGSVHAGTILKKTGGG